jgi:hypothetical protein
MTTDDERFEQYLREAAADYEAPRSEVPRGDMWAAIQSQRGAMMMAPRRAPLSARRWTWIGMAATLLLGVGIGRFAMRDGAAPDAKVPQIVATTRAPIVPEHQAVAPTSAVSPPSTESSAPVYRSPAAPNSASYTVASERHLQAVQLLLASYTTDAPTARGDSLLGRWARDLLSNTRLLLDSPAARDQQRARLLEDLEVILVQLVQQAPGQDIEERSAIERTLQKTQVIPRLRSALPASLHSGTD